MVGPHFKRSTPMDSIGSGDPAEVLLVFAGVRLRNQRFLSHSLFRGRLQREGKVPDRGRTVVFGHRHRDVLVEVANFHVVV